MGKVAEEPVRMKLEEGERAALEAFAAELETDGHRGGLGGTARVLVIEALRRRGFLPAPVRARRRRG